MKQINFTLRDGTQIHLTEVDVKNLKPIIDKAFANLDDNLYHNLKVSNKETIEITLKSMSEEQLIEFAKTNDLFKIKHSYKQDSFTQKIFREIFIRKGIGYKQIRHLSRKQRNLIESLGISSK